MNTFLCPLECLFIIITSFFYEPFSNKHFWKKKVGNSISVIISLMFGRGKTKFICSRFPFPKSINSSELQETTLDYQKSLQWSKWDGKTAQRLSLGEIKLSLGQLSTLLIAIVTHQTLQSRAIACFQDLLSIWTGWKNWIAKFASDHPAQSGMLWHHKTTERGGMCMYGLECLTPIMLLSLSNTK